MSRWIALLRGINVGTKGRIRMDALKQVFEDAGFSHVSTYIQSGNVLFDTDLPEQEAREAIEQALLSSATITTTATLRSAQELEALIQSCPFSADALAEAQHLNTEGESFYVCLLPQMPTEQALASLAKIPLAGETYVVSGRDIYLLLQTSIRLSKFAIRLQKLFPTATMRNWNTMCKLQELSKID